jgi:predicted DNA-binding transcriptional regulator AlpA
MEKQGNFPRRIALGPNRTVWLAAEIDQWMHERIAASRGEKPRQRGLM